ncbi:MAG: ABC transporter ATP-binding protein [Dehalococcoidia bacterium]
MMNNNLIQANNLSRNYTLKGEKIQAIKNINLSIDNGEFLTLVGRSGSGKTTLLNLLAGLDQPSDGNIFFKGQNINDYDEKEQINFRRFEIGVIFQSFSLLPLLSAYENIELPMRISGITSRERNKRTISALKMIGLEKRGNHRPYELSGGEQQRISIARAVAMRPKLLLADEPTGELDSVNAFSIFSLFKEMVDDQNMSIIATTHDRTLLDLSDKTLNISDGEIIS